MARRFSRRAAHERMSKVYLVGAGPGDPDLITWKGRKILALADSILYDHLANDALLDLAPPRAERLYVGKKKSEHPFSQEQICALLIDRARRGLTVVRLKGGDPFIFGRGGEEAEALADAGIPFEVIPGVTSPLGIAAYSGVPLTHRDHTSVVTFVTGHNVESIDWSKIGHAETLVIFMGLTSIRDIATEIVAHGRSANTPAMAVRWGTRPDQQTIAATLATIADRIDETHLKPPATVIVGEVVRLREKLNWYEHLPLFGQKILITRARDQAADLSERLRALGADAIEAPVISLEPPADSAPLDRAIAQLSSYDWLIFTSANGVRFFFDALDRSPTDLRQLRARICAIGPATRRAVEACHLKVDLMPADYVAEGIVSAFGKIPLGGVRILLPRAAAARDLVPKALAKRGAEVDVIASYQNVIPAEARERLSNALRSESRPNWIAFTSTSTVDNFIAIAGTPALNDIRIASIGPVTTHALEAHGLHADAEARSFTIDGLIETILSSHR